MIGEIPITFLVERYKKYTNNNKLASEYSILRLKNIIKKHKKNYYFLDGDLDSLRESISLVESYGDDDTDDYLFVKDYQSLMANFLKKNPRKFEFLSF